MDDKNLNEAINILTEMQKWRRAQPPYDGNTPETHKEMPYSPKTIGHAIDFAIGFMESIKEFFSTRKSRIV